MCTPPGGWSEGAPPLMFLAAFEDPPIEVIERVAAQDEIVAGERISRQWETPSCVRESNQIFTAGSRAGTDRPGGVMTGCLREETGLEGNAQFGCGRAIARAGRRRRRMAQGRQDVRRGWPLQRVFYRPRPPPSRPPLPLSCCRELAPAKEERSTSLRRRSTAGERLPLAA